MTAYMIARLNGVRMGEEIRTYLQRIDATLAPYDGYFVVHGGETSKIEGAWDGDLIMIAFPDRERARLWYGSPAYQAILPLRTRNSTGDVILVDGVDRSHRATDILL